MKESPHPGLFIVTALISFGLLLVHVPIIHPAWMYTLVFIGTSLLYFWFAWLILRTTITRQWLSIGIGVALLIRLSFLTTSPIGSDDVYRYMWDGKVQSANINPYLYAPDSSALKPLHSVLLPGAVNHPNLKTLYFPFSLWSFYVCYQLSGESVWGYKVLVLLAEGATILALLWLLRLRRIPARFVLLYAFCPLPILQFALDCHLDAIGFPFLLFGLFLYLSERKIPGLVLIGLSMSVKPVALVLLPVLFIFERSWNRRLLTIVVPAATILLQFIPYVVSSNPFEALSTFAKNWTFNGVAFEGLYAITGDNQKARLACLLLLSLALLLVYVKQGDLFSKIHVSVLLLLIFSPVVHPWYIVWMVVLLPLTQRWSGITYAATACLTSVTILSYKLYGVWDQPRWALIVEYLPVLMVMGWELSKQGLTDPHPIYTTEMD